MIKAKEAFVLGKRVWHKKFGIGIVFKVGVVTVSVRFENREEHFFVNNAIKKEEFFEYK